MTHPPGSEEAAREFYGGLLGLSELPKPPELSDRGGVWFAAGAVQLHFGVEAEGPPSPRHLALEADDLYTLRARLEGAGYRIEEAVALPGASRFYSHDPFGNKLELITLEAE
ncbi:MAG: VOC family protein [Chloroflexota bacterium]|nr:VOC family protein [Chloroflexota bacterium]